MNKLIGMTGLIISLLVQGFSESDSLTHKIAMACLFLFLLVYNFNHTKEFSKKSLVIIGASFIVLMLGIYQFLFFTGDYFESRGLNFGFILLLEIVLVIGLVTAALSLIKHIADCLRKTPDGKER
ncbi:YoqO family protein [Bacillus amyloliquefaciens]|uniref:YoqO family protein n=1 Tax=Bacillus amyloliquefaciens TaxID=1390 RepID=UPI003F4A3479